ncbi:MAG: murein biosynthesis integral membrane protein MurJ [Clostridia bacterium]|nr:murein biosynthesis integral membrane protein MurJ [Clostridia bacterium]
MNRQPDRVGSAAKKGSQSLTVATVLMMAGLLLSKFSGQLREILIAPIFGYGEISDAFIIGFQVPDLFYQLLVGGAIQAAITPTLAGAVARRDVRSSWRSVSIFINLTALTVLIAVLFGELLAPQLVAFYNRGKEPAVIEAAVKVSRALFPQVFFMMMAALCIGILNAYKKFSSTAFGPTIYNICVVLAMVLLGASSARGAVRVASGVLIASAIYFTMQFWLAREPLRHYVFSFDWRDPGFRTLLALAIPTLISGSIIQVNTMILTGFARQFPGAVTSLRNASTIWQLPYGVIVVAIGSVMLPSLAGYFATDNHSGCRHLLSRSLRNALFLMLPAAGLFLAMQQDTVRAIFQWGSGYGEEAVSHTAAILRWYCFAMIAQTFIFLINQAFYARRMTRIALYNGVMTLVLNTLFCFALTRWTSLGVSSLSLAYTLTSVISAVILYRLYGWLDPAVRPARLWPYLIRVLTALTALLLTVILLNLIPWVPSGKTLQLIWYGLRCLAGFAAYLLIAWKVGLNEAADFAGKVKARLGRRSPL